MITRRLVRPLSASPASNWVCPSCARASLPQTQLRQRQIRKLHNIPPLSHANTFSVDGVPGLLSPTGFKIAWTQHMEMIVAKLNELTAGDATEFQKPKDIVLATARDPMNASLFNHASMLENSRLFFEGLSTAPAPLDAKSSAPLKKSLEQTFGSIDTLRTAFLDTAAAMFGPGFVWLVWARDVGSTAAALGRRNGDWRILATYNAGTPYPEAGYRQQGLDMNNSNAQTYQAYYQAQPVNNAGAFGRHTARGREDASIPPGGTQVMPVLCVSTWQHVYLFDYGVQGKRKYLADWWDAVDWGKVEGLTPREALQATFLRS